MKRYVIEIPDYVQGLGYAAKTLETGSRAEACEFMKNNLDYSFSEAYVKVYENGEVVQEITFTGKQISECYK